MANAFAFSCKRKERNQKKKKVKVKSSTVPIFIIEINKKFKMDKELTKSKPLTKEETKALLQLIEASKVITNKCTNATNNKVKTEEWNQIAVNFNASAASFCPRTPQQLRLKWENLKKNARKRSTQIRMNRLKTGGGAGDYVPPDEILDRVLSLLGSTASGFDVPFGGDRCYDYGEATTNGEAKENLTPKSTSESGETSGSEVPVPSCSAQVLALNDLIMHDADNKDIAGKENPKKLSDYIPKKGKFKRQGNNPYIPHPSKVEKDLAIAGYFNTKKKCVEEKLEFFILTNENLKLENEKLKQEIENMKNK
ncbi:uncharacterized protein LOC135076250 [Ostrinia nubilalis]|uniref:uncharacterized protein LOC135076250 n=1 Tax=Ostrinia nubilalis TaxID=29057 RepID=UPI0030823A3B